MMESVKKVEATRAERMATEPRRLTADEKDALLKEFHPDYNPDAFAQIKVGPNKGPVFNYIYIGRHGYTAFVRFHKRPPCVI